MTNPTRAMIKFRLLLGLAVAIVVLGAGAYAVRNWQRSRNMKQALIEGRAAFDRQDWKTASHFLGRYVSRNLDRFSDPEVANVARLLAEAQLSIHPLQAEFVSAAVNTYRRLLRDAPFDPRICERLAFIYQSTGQPVELDYIAKRLREHAPDDPRPDIWLAQAAIAKQDPSAAAVLLESLVRRLEGDAARRQYFIRACLMLASLPDSEDGGSRARWLDHAVSHAPDDGDVRIARAAFLRQLAASATPDERDRLLAAALDDIAVAERAESMSAIARRLLCQELLLHAQWDRAARQIEAMRALPMNDIHTSYLDLDAWRLDIALQSMQLASQRGRFEEALSIAETALQQHAAPHHRATLLPVNIELAASLGKTVLAEERLAEYLRIVGAGTPEIEARKAYLRALLLIARNEPYEAIQLLEPLRPLEDFSEPMRSVLARAYQQVGQLARAALLFEGIVPMDPSLLPSVLLAIDRELRRGEYGPALQKLQALEDRFPDNIAVKLARIDADVMQADARAPGEWRAARESAVQRLSSLRDQFPKEASIRTKLAVMLVSIERGAEAMEELRKGADECDDGATLALQMARFQFLAGRANEADAAYRRACEQFASQPAVWIARADFLVERLAHADARALLESAIESVSPAGRPPVIRRLAALELQDDAAHAAGAARLLRLADADQSDVQSRALLLQSERFRLDRPMARKLVEQIRAIEGETGLRWRLYQARLAMDDVVDAAPETQSELTSTAEELLNFCIRADPLWQQPVLMLGDLYQSRDRFEEAERLYRRSLDATVSAPVADRLLSLLEQQRRFVEALALMNQYFTAYAAPAYAARRLSLALASGDPDVMTRQVEMLADQQPDEPQFILLSARLAYAVKRDAAEAERLLKEAEAVGANPIAVATTRLSILQNENRVPEARAMLDEMVQRADTFDVHALRAAFLATIGDFAAAEADYRSLPSLVTDSRGYEHLAEFFAARLRFDDTIATCQAGLEAFPEAVNLKRGLSKALFVRRAPGDIDRAVKVLETLPPAKFDTDLRWVKAMLIEAQRGPNAIAEIRRVLTEAAVHPRASVETYRGLVSLALRVGAMRQAEELLRGAEFEHGQSHPLLRLARAQVLIARGEAPAALGLLREAVRLRAADPENYETLLSVPPDRASAATLREFESALQRGLAAAPDNIRLHLAAARMLRRMDRPQDAADHLDALLQKGPPDEARLDILLTLIDLHKSMRSFDRAEAYLAQAESMAPQAAAVIMARIAVRGARGETDAIADLVRTMRDRADLTDRQKDEIAIFAAQVVTATADAAALEKALPLLAASVERSPSFVPHRLALALTFFRVGRLDEAERAYREVLQLDPDRDEALNNLAWIVGKERGRPAEALDFARRAVEIRPEDPEYAETLGELLKALPGQMEAARAEYARAVRLWDARSPRRARAYWKLGLVCKELNQRDEAVRCLDTALRLDQIAAGGSQPAFQPAEREELQRMLDDIRRSVAN